MKNENFYNLHADMCKTISNPRRQAILDTIRNGEMTVSALIKKTGISQANLSQHLSILRSKGVVNTRRDGNNVYYSLSNLKIIKAYDLISEVLEDSATSRDKAIKEGMGR
ncbi:MAG: metalloregulator ArsR/SmtB family transcription factor [Actinobacteria bacterium]|nr:metalloregulator ArsR/SmtB family transcription factor [Actinomycetota bacterium]